MIRSLSLFQASQQWSTMSSKDLKIRFESQFSRMNCHTFSCGFSSGHFCRQRDQRDVGRDDQSAREMPASLIDEKGDVGTRCDLGGDFGEVEVHRLCIASWHGTLERRALAVLGTDRAEDIGQAVRWSFGALGRVPRLAQRRVILFFWPTRASSANQTSMAVGSMPFSCPICARRSGRLF